MGDFYDETHGKGKVLFLFNPHTPNSRQSHIPLVDKYGFENIESEDEQKFTKHEIERRLKEAAALDYSDCDNFLCVIETHGNLEKDTRRRMIYGVEPSAGNELYVEQMLSLFNSLKGKPKIFMISACAGDGIQTGLAGDNEHKGAEPSASKKKEAMALNGAAPVLERQQANVSDNHTVDDVLEPMRSYSFPDDCCVIYTSPKGYGTYSSISYNFMEALKDYDTKPLLEIITVAMNKMTLAAQRVIQDEVPSAYLEHSLTADVRLKNKEVTEEKKQKQKRGEETEQSSDKDGLDSYEWTAGSDQKGSCRIEIFYFRYSENGFPERDPKENDVDEMRRLVSYFKEIGLKVNQGDDLSFHLDMNPLKQEIESKLKEIAEDNKKYDCYFFVFLCFGRGEEIFCHDGETILTDDLLEPFKENKIMLGKPKIFCFQACDLDKHGEKKSRKGPPDEKEVTPLIPIEADFMTIHSNIPARYKASSSSYTDGERHSDASFLIQAFVKAIEGTREGRSDLLQLTTRMNRKVKNYITGSEGLSDFHVPRVTSTLTKLLDFPPKVKKGQDNAHC